MKLDSNAPTDAMLLHIVIRVPKEFAAFTYFQFESNEGLCFYSTLDQQRGQGFRDIDLVGSLDFEEEIRHILKQLKLEFPLEILVDETLKDAPMDRPVLGMK